MARKGKPKKYEKVNARKLLITSSTALITNAADSTALRGGGQPLDALIEIGIVINSSWICGGKDVY